MKEKIFLTATGGTTKTMPQFVVDAMNLGNDALAWIIAASAVIAAVLLAKEIVVWYKANQNEKPQHAKQIQNILVGAVGVIIGEAVLKFVLSYFIH